MNFFGHAAIAASYRDEPGFVLGAMLPDFLTMIRARQVAQLEPHVSAGVALHHATDAVFHETPEFLALTREGRAALLAAGLSRGPARAVAHIGVELLLDEVLARDIAHQRAYLAALDYGRSAASALTVALEADTARLARLFGTLAERGVRSPQSDTELALRIERMLAGRPRLALGEGGGAIVEAWLTQTRAAVAASAPRLLGTLRAHLDRREGKS